MDAIWTQQGNRLCRQWCAVRGAQVRTLGKALPTSMQRECASAPGQRSSATRHGCTCQRTRSFNESRCSVVTCPIFWRAASHVYHALVDPELGEVAREQGLITVDGAQRVPSVETDPRGGGRRGDHLEQPLSQHLEGVTQRRRDALSRPRQTPRARGCCRQGFDVDPHRWLHASTLGRAARRSA